MVQAHEGAPLAPDPLGRSLAEVLAVVGPLHRRAVRAVERAAEMEELPIGVRTVLEVTQILGPRPVPRIAESLALSRQFVQRSVDVALAQELVELQPNPAHQRSPLVALTAEGDERIARLQAREHSVLQAVGGELTERDVEACLKVLHRLLSVIEPVEQPGDPSPPSPRRRGQSRSKVTT